MSDVDGLVAWLSSVWDADEQAASVAGPDECGHWTARGHTLDLDQYEVTVHPATAAHVARHDPADTLARIEGERRVLEDYRSTDAAIRREVDSGIARDDPWLERMRAVRDAQRAAVRALAFGYRHRPGWQEEWTP